MAIATDEPRRLVSAHRFVRTYSNHVYDDPWEAVEEYRQVQAIANGSDSPSSRAIADEFDLPRGRVYPWLNGSRPDCVRGLQTAQRRGWIDVSTDSDAFRGLNVLVAWVFAGGSISKDTYAPYFVANDENDEAILKAAADLANVELESTRPADGPRAVEFRAKADGSVLGRALSVLQAPVGDKNTAGDLTLPDYLAQVDEAAGREFVQTYVHNRGQPSEDGSLIVRFRDRRSERYLKAVARLVRGLTGEPVTVREGDVFLSAPAARELENWDPLLGGVD